MTTLRADVLILGGGPAGAWAAVTAAEAGASVVLADKGWCGSSGAAAAGGNNLWYVPGGPARLASIEQREREGGDISERPWMERVLEQTWQGVDRLAEWGYPFPTDDTGTVRRSSLQGPQYMRLMRQRAKRAGVTLLDHSPALHLLTDDDGVVSGAVGTQLQHDHQPWTVTAGAVVLATGGCAFLSGALGCNVDTGDGHLMAAELGASLSGMEFSCAYGTAPGFGAQTKGRLYQFARWYDAEANLLDIPAGFAGRAQLGRTMLTQEVYARLDLAPAELRDSLRWAQPNFFLPFIKAGIDPFADVFPVRLVCEGTVRGTGGLQLTDDDCSTTVPGLFAAGDAATRELITGGRSGGGSHNGAWAISSGTFAGRGAAEFALRRREIQAVSSPVAVPGLPRLAVTAGEIVRSVQDQVLPIGKNLFRTGTTLAQSLRTLDDLWVSAVPALAGGPEEAARNRSAAAMVAHARWMFTAALTRTESRGMHQRDDHPGRDEGQTRRLLVGGLDEVWTEWSSLPRERVAA